MGSILVICTMSKFYVSPMSVVSRTRTPMVEPLTTTAQITMIIVSTNYLGHSVLKIFFLFGLEGPSLAPPTKGPRPSEALRSLVRRRRGPSAILHRALVDAIHQVHRPSWAPSTSILTLRNVQNILPISRQWAVADEMVVKKDRDT